jgi:hypothetical protein
MSGPPIGTFENVVVVGTLDPVAKNATWSSTGIDRYGYSDVVMCVYFGTGSSLSGSVYYTLAFEDSDTSVSTGFGTIAAADIEGGLTPTYVCNSTSKDNQIIVRGYKGTKRWVRVTATLTGSDSGTTLTSCFVILGNPTIIPTTPVTEA